MSEPFDWDNAYASFLARRGFPRCDMVAYTRADAIALLNPVLAEEFAKEFTETPKFDPEKVEHFDINNDTPEAGGSEWVRASDFNKLLEMYHEIKRVHDHFGIGLGIPPKVEGLMKMGTADNLTITEV